MEHRAFRHEPFSPELAVLRPATSCARSRRPDPSSVAPHLCQTKISHTRSRYIYDLYYKREAISKDLYDWLLKEQYADAKSVVSGLSCG